MPPGGCHSPCNRCPRPASRRLSKHATAIRRLSRFQATVVCSIHRLRQTQIRLPLPLGLLAGRSVGRKPLQPLQRRGRPRITPDQRGFGGAKPCGVGREGQQLVVLPEREESARRLFPIISSRDTSTSRRALGTLPFLELPVAWFSGGYVFATAIFDTSFSPWRRHSGQGDICPQAVVVRRLITIFGLRGEVVEGLPFIRGIESAPVEIHLRDPRDESR